MAISKSVMSLLLLAICISACSAQPGLESGRREVLVSETLEYYLYFPPDYDQNSDVKFPLLLFLHGGGESGADLDLLRENGPPKLLAEGKEFPFLILAPQNPHKQQWWNVRAVMMLLESVRAEHRVDTNRLYLTGLSRGGNACWEIATQYPETFAAMAVVCGMTPVPYAHWISKSMPIWVFHGTDDPVIPFSESEEMVRKLKEMGYDAQLTAYKGVGHNAWEKAYQEERLYTWFLSHSR
ncbi:MAG: PHB depolymerase family esterase [Robiginitalea sp.]|uniref:carboxylesterase family protein n=1 Tax=Robiginitalea sp. TaxID=1902411 RepID=UPI003C78AFFA